jgi:hypothetical protein
VLSIPPQPNNCWTPVVPLVLGLNRILHGSGIVMSLWMGCL